MGDRLERVEIPHYVRNDKSIFGVTRARSEEWRAMIIQEFERLKVWSQAFHGG